MKKNVMTAIVSGAMVGCLAIGGTFAYLTANSGTVKNTFTGSAALGVKIQETTKDGDTYDVKYNDTLVGTDETKTPWLGAGEDGGFKYINVVPGAELEKKVQLQVQVNPTDSYLFAKVSGESENFDLNIGEEWEKIATLDDGSVIYALTEDGELKVISTKENTAEFTVFTKVDVADTLTADDLAEGEVNNIVVTGAVVQATGITADQAKTEAIDLLK